MQPAVDIAVDLFDNWFDPIEAEVGARSREFIEELLRGGAGALELVLTATMLIRFCVATDAIDAPWAGAGLVFDFLRFAGCGLVFAPIAFPGDGGSGRLAA